ncbi:MAG: hypothetical protein IJZ86_05325 [Bacteroides sp.]|nr:hypothetical protein [Bacteroides sp.]
MTEEEIHALVKEGREWIAHYGGQQTISFPDEEAEQLKREENAMTEQIVSNIIGTSLKSPQTIINKVYNRIGFNAVQDEELRHLVVSRICSPMSKNVTTLYFETTEKDELRESGFSKDGKNSNNWKQNGYNWYKGLVHDDVYCIYTKDKLKDF